MGAWVGGSASALTPLQLPSLSEGSVPKRGLDYEARWDGRRAEGFVEARKHRLQHNTS